MDNDPATNNGQNPARSVLQNIRPATTLAGRTRQRMKWTDEINRQLLLCYYTVTNLEQNTTGYRTDLHCTFINIYPELRDVVTEQTFADQIRVIFKNNRIPSPEMDNTRRHAGNAIQDNNELQAPRNATPKPDSPLYTPTTDTPAQRTSTPCTPAPMTANQTNQIFNEIYTQYQGMDPLSRPIIPRPQNMKNIKTIIETVNNIIQNKIEELNNNINIEEIITLVYRRAATIIQIHNQPHKNNNNQTKRKTRIPQWQHRLEKKIAILRKKIGITTQYLNDNLKKRLPHKLIPPHSPRQKVTEILNNKKQKLQALAKRLKRYKKSYQRKQENKLFDTNQKMFYRSLQN